MIERIRGSFKTQQNTLFHSTTGTEQVKHLEDVVFSGPMVIRADGPTHPLRIHFGKIDMCVGGW